MSHIYSHQNLLIFLKTPTQISHMFVVQSQNLFFETTILFLFLAIQEVKSAFEVTPDVPTQKNVSQENECLPNEITSNPQW